MYIDENSPKICFSYSTEEIVNGVQIETSRLSIRSVTNGNLQEYIDLFGDSVAMEKYASGNTTPPEKVTTRFNGWLRRWENGDPFSALAVFEKQSGSFIGHIILGYGDKAGQSETAILLKPSFWQHGYGREAMEALLEHYAPKLSQMEFKIDGELFREIVATARVDSIASNRILSSYMTLEGQVESYGAIRNKYSKELSQEDSGILERINTTAEIITSVAA